jgi:hypothetical protein
MSVLDAAVAEALKQLTGKEQQINEIEPDDLIMKQMNEFGIKDLPIQIQDHFVSVRQKMREHFIEITGWQIIKYEIFYTFSREGLNAGIKTWINKDLKFNGKYMTVPSLTNNEAFAKETEGFINHLPQVVLKRHTSETILDKVIFDIDVEEQFPFTKNLFDDLCEFLSKSNISVENIDHQNFRERYTLVRGSEKVILDFEYDKKGFFGRVLPLTSQSNSNILLAEITDIIKQLKNRTNAI